MQCSLGQGFWFSRPLTVTDAEELISSSDAASRSLWSTAPVTGTGAGLTGGTSPSEPTHPNAAVVSAGDSIPPT